MPDYRLYFFRDGHIRRVVDLDCEDDEHAIRLVEEHRDGRAMELWQRDRLIKSFPAES